MKKILIGILLTSATYSYAQTINAEQIKKDNVTIKGNAAHQLRADTTFLATRYYVDSVAGGASFDTTSMSNRIDLKIDSVRRIPGTDSVVEYYNNGVQRHAFIDSVSASTIAASAWSLTGNAGTVEGTNFHGTTDSTALVWKTNSLKWMRLRQTGQLELMSGYDTFTLGGITTSFPNLLTNNLFIGDSAGFSAPYSSFDSLAPHNNTAIGRHAMRNIEVAWANTAVGTAAMFSLRGKWGYTAHNPFTPYGGGYENVAVGVLAGGRCDSCYENTFVGTGSGYECIGGNGNSFFGLSAGRFTRNSFNTALGAFSLFDNVNGDQNVAVGYAAGSHALATGNIFLGYLSGHLNATGQFNTWIGYQAGQVSSGGIANVAIGYEAGRANTGTGNIFLGQGAGRNQTSGDYFGYIDSRYRDALRKDTSWAPLWFFSGVDSSTTFVKVGGKLAINDGTNSVVGKRLYLSALNGFAAWSNPEINTTANDSATINKVSGRLRSNASTFVLVNSFITANSIIDFDLMGDLTSTGIAQISYTCTAGSATITFYDINTTTGVPELKTPAADQDVSFKVEN